MKKIIFAILILCTNGFAQEVKKNAEVDNQYLSWNMSQAMKIGQDARVKGRVGGMLDWRVIHTEHSYNYKLRATWMSPDVIRASARVRQLLEGLTDSQTRALVAEAEAVGDTVVMIEIDPREGSGVIPSEWNAFLGLRGSKPGEPAVIKGEKIAKGADIRALSGVYRRDYNYDVFLVAFPLGLKNSELLDTKNIKELELTVNIYNKTGHVVWRFPESLTIKH